MWEFERKEESLKNDLTKYLREKHNFSEVNEQKRTPKTVTGAKMLQIMPTKNKMSEELKFMDPK